MSKHQIQDFAESEDPNQQYAKANRQDLTMSFGIALTMPPGAFDVDGNWWYGVWGPPSALSQSPPSEFAAEMIKILDEQQYPLYEQGILDDGALASLSPHYYQIGPASESWPSYFFDIYKHVRPFVRDGADLLAWGYFFKSVLGNIQSWVSQKNAMWSDVADVRIRQFGKELTPSELRWHPVNVAPVLTQMAVVSLCFQHAVKKYGLGGQATVDVFPRGWYYGSVEHP